MFWKLDLFLSSDDGKEMPTPLGSLEIANLNHLNLKLLGTEQCLSLPSPEDGNRYSFRNVVFSRYLEFRTLDEVHKLSYSHILLKDRLSWL
jgi:hypothetical protein